jgi:glycerol kinase
MIPASSAMETLARSVPDCGGVQFVPALSGLGAPYWRPEARGVITGLTRGSTKAHLARATLEAMALQNVDILSSMVKDTKSKLKFLRVDGGAAQNNLLMEMQADFLGAPIERPEHLETTSAGAAYLAGLAVGYWKSLSELKSVIKIERRFQPQMPSRRRAERLKQWQAAVAKA